MTPPMQSVHVVKDLDALQVLSNPRRVRILAALREPASAAAVARSLGEPRQRVNYHLKELERAGLVERVDEQRVGNFIETRFRASARSFVVAPEVAWADPRRVETLREQHALEDLVLAGGRLQRDAAALLDAAAFDGAQIASASVDVEVSFADEAARADFLRDYLDAVKDLCERYGARRGAPYRALLAVYPQPGNTEGAPDHG